MSKAGYSIEPLVPDLLPQLVPLMADVFGGEPQIALFEWKYLRNPAGPAIGHVARNADGELAAFYGMIPEIYRWGDVKRRIYQSCDTMTHSRHRRKGLFQLLARATYAAAEEADPSFFAIGFSGPMSTPGFFKMGWTSPMAIPHRFKPRFLAKLGFPGRKGPEVSKAIPPSLANLMQLREATRQNSKMFYPEFVEWRFTTPAIHYFYIIDAGAFAVFKRSSTFIYLLDFWEAEPRAGRGVMRTLQRQVAQPGCRGLLTACQQGSDTDRMIRAYDFLQNPFNRGPASARTPFIIYGDPPVPVAQTAAGWQLTALDFDSL